jgi:hypothetical protein
MLHLRYYIGSANNLLLATLPLSINSQAALRYTGGSFRLLICGVGYAFSYY